jgi:hypothetical protein
VFFIGLVTNHDGDGDAPPVAAASKPKVQPTKKENATLEQRIAILDWHRENNATQKETAAHFDKAYPSL